MPKRNPNPLPLDGLKADYDLARRNSRFRRKRRGVDVVGNGADYHYRSESDYLYAMEFARDLDRNDVIAGMLVDRLCDNILQDVGLVVDPETGDENLDAELKARWHDYSQNEDACDLSGEHSWPALERMALRASIVDGDIVLLPNKSGALEVMEAHRLRTPSNTKRNVVHGILLDERRRRLEYWFTRADIDPWRSLSRVSDIAPVRTRAGDGTRQVFHVYDPDRVSQTRGVSAFHRTGDLHGMHDDLEFAKLVQAQITSVFAIIRQRELDFQGTGNQQYGTRTTETIGSHTRLTEEISPGMEILGEPGETIEGFSANVPNAEFFDHVMLLLKLISANLGLPMHAVLLDPSQTNFSGWRGALQQAKIGFRRIQAWLARNMHRRVYRWRVRNWLIADPRLQTLAGQGGVDAFKHRWRFPTWDYIEPMKDVSADVLAQSSLQNSPRRIQAQHGRDWQDVSKEIVDDNLTLIRYARLRARDLNAEAEGDDETIHWRDLIGLLSPKHGVVLNVSADGAEAEPEDDEEEESEITNLKSQLPNKSQLSRLN